MGEMTKILIVSNTAFSLYNFRRGIMRALRDKGYEVVASAIDDRFSERIEKEGFKFIPIKNLNRKGTNPFEDLKLLFELYKIYRKEKPSLILHFTVKPNVYGAIAARFLNIPSVSSITGLGYLFMKRNTLNRIAARLYRVALSYARKVIFQNEEDKRLFVDGNIVKEDKTVITPGSGVDTAFFSPESCNVVERSKGKLIFLLVSRMLWDKGVGEFVEAAKSVKKEYSGAEFWLLGDIDKGNPSAISEEQIRIWQESGDIEYPGATVDVRQFICKAHVVVLPSYREGVPRSLLEAMAMEKPVITTDAAGCRETVEDGVNGFLVPVKDSHELATAMIKMIEMGEGKRIGMGKKGREKVLREFDEKIVIEKYLEIIGEVLGPTGSMA